MKFAIVQGETVLEIENFENFEKSDLEKALMYY